MNTANIYPESVCPVCHHQMTIVSAQYYLCTHCREKYQEKAICPLCNEQLNVIKGCGAINYLCTTDGLISSRQVQFHYSVIL